MDESEMATTAVGTLFVSLLTFFGWHNRKLASNVDNLRDRTTRLEATAVDVEDMRKLLREEVGLHLKDGERRMEQVEKSVEKVFDRLDEMRRDMPKRAADAPAQN